MVEHSATFGLEARKESDRHWPRALFFSVILLFSHILDIDPSSFDAGGIKISVSDPAIIRGGIALALYYYFWMFVVNGMLGSIYLPFDINRQMLKSFVKQAKRPYAKLGGGLHKRYFRKPAQVKRAALIRVIFYNIFMLPFGLAIFLILASGVVVGGFDLHALAQFVMLRLEAA